MEELRAVIVILNRPEFKPAEIEDKRIARAVLAKMIKSFDMRVSSRARDCNQDLTKFTREVEQVVREIMGDSCFKGHRHYKFEAEFDDADGERLWRGRPVQALPSR